MKRLEIEVKITGNVVHGEDERCTGVAETMEEFRTFSDGENGRWSPQDRRLQTPEMTPRNADQERRQNSG